VSSFWRWCAGGRRALGLPFSLWTGDRLSDYLAERTGVRHEPRERLPAAARGAST
jgi:hypothetical protein